jgi:hypothetical protein
MQVSLAWSDARSHVVKPQPFFLCSCGVSEFWFLFSCRPTLNTVHKGKESLQTFGRQNVSGYYNMNDIQFVPLLCFL